METQIKKTPYEWCLEANVRILNLEEWPLNSWPFGDGQDPNTWEKNYFREKINKEDFLSALSKCKVKPNSQPRKTPDYLEYRMYGLVPYNISPIQQGIQFGHAVVEYAQKIRGHEEDEKRYNKWARFDKTFIILNGGTTNSSPDRLGTLNKYHEDLINAGILTDFFSEPDLGDQLTAVVFLVDERVWNRDLYEDFVPEVLPWSKNKPSEKKLLELEDRNNVNYGHWVTKIGGERNAFLRKYLRNLKLA
jgi:hypothetical protein